MKGVSFEVRGVTWQQIWETDSWRSIPWKNNWEEFILLEIERLFEKMQTNSRDMTLLWIQGISCSSMGLLDGVGEVILPFTSLAPICIARSLELAEKTQGSISQRLPSPEAWRLKHGDEWSYFSKISGLEADHGLTRGLSSPGSTFHTEKFTVHRIQDPEKMVTIEVKGNQFFSARNSLF